MEKLHRARGSIQGSVTSFSHFLDGFKDKAILDFSETLEVETRLHVIVTTLESFNARHQEIIDLIPEGDEHVFETEELKKHAFENLYFSQIARAKAYIVQSTPLPTVSPNSGPSTSFNNAPSLPSASSAVSNSVQRAPSAFLQQIQLPKINLPMFSGTPDCWLEFRDKYVSLIHTNSDIGDMQRYHYLRACLSGEASMVIQGVEFSTDNYLEAWDMLCARYNNPRVLMHNHIKALFNIESLQCESATKLRSMHDNLIKHIGALNRLNKDANTDLFAVLITFIVTSKFDTATARDWEEHQDANIVPTIDSLKQFIRDKADLLSTLDIKHTCDRTNNININKHSSKQKHFNTRQNTSSHLVYNQNKPLKCASCKGDHYLRNCPDLLKLLPTDRYTLIKSMNRCINCLRFGHQALDCSASMCRKCSKKHHTLLHFEASDLTSQPSLSNDTSHTVVTNSNTMTSLSNSSSPCVLLSTALVNVVGAQGNIFTARVLLDGGSQSNFITESFARRLGLHFSSVDVTVSGFSLATSPIKFSCQAKITAIRSTFQLFTNFLVSPRITELVPSVSIDTSSINIPSNLSLADPTYGKPGPIDMLLGAEHFFSLLCVGQISLGRGKPTLQKSKFGWLVSGMAAGRATSRITCNFSQSLGENLTRFWEVEEIPSSPKSLYDVHPCEQLFQETIKRDSEGRYIVSIPTVNLDELGDSREIALKRFLNIERSLNNHPALKQQYVSFMDEYISLGHMSTSTSMEHPVYYLPHHSVKKESSTTTKLRVVFDGSAKPLFGKSINECQLVGPCIQDDLFSILLNFRKHSIAFTADIAKMYRQILVDPQQRSLQRIFWRSSSTEPLQTYDLNTITYGTASASYLSTRCLMHIADTIATAQPSVARCIKHDFYVDDLLSGADTEKEALQLIHGVKTALDQACLPLRKWTSNRPEILHGLDNSFTSDIDFASLDNFTSTTLGLIWNSKLDIFKYRINIASHKHISKRTILSNISAIFDPLGLLSPCIIVAKIIIQKLWSQGLGWDESLPLSILQEWTTYRDCLPTLNSISIPRPVLCHNFASVELHGFSDASLKAYGAVLYLRCTDKQGNITCSLLCSKGKVAPLKTITIPRLELCGAHLLALLYTKVSKSLNVTFSAVTFWCDSTIVLSWIRQCPSTLQTFVGNRVSQIQTMTQSTEWRHVPTLDNPADSISRGFTPKQLIDSAQWWQGPNWLHEPPSCWPSNYFEPVDILELRPSATILLSVSAKLQHPVDATIYSSYSKLIGVTSYVIRFLHNIRNPLEKKVGFITSAERQTALNSLLKFQQTLYFREEIISLSKCKPLHPNSKLLSLSPFLDDEGLIRVGGRLDNSNLHYSGEHPILLPTSNHLVKLIFRHEHIRLLHIGPLGLLNAIRQKYWPLGGRNVARRVVHECVLCFRAKPRSTAPEIGQLPVARVTPTPPFYHCGIDYAGPFILKTLPGRGCKTYKAYVALFICFSTKAIHLELVTDLTTQAFVAALRRLIARRGKPAVVYSDNGTNFIGAQRELNELGKFLKNSSSLLERTVDSEGINWKFIPARSPHFGGIWEAGVKSTKYHLKRIVGAQLLTYEDFYTFLVQVEAILNSRPITPLSSDPNDLLPLTPAHFLVGRPLVSLPDEDFSNACISSCLRYKHAQAMSQHFWNRWSKDYLNTLQQRTKWNKPADQSNIEINTLVLLVEEGLPPMRWRMGRILALHPGKDGVVRVVSIKTTSGIVKRAVRRICPLPQHEELASTPALKAP